MSGFCSAPVQPSVRPPIKERHLQAKLLKLQLLVLLFNNLPAVRKACDNRRAFGPEKGHLCQIADEVLYATAITRVKNERNRSAAKSVIVRLSQTQQNLSNTPGTPCLMRDPGKKPNYYYQIAIEAQHKTSLDTCPARHAWQVLKIEQVENLLRLEPPASRETAIRH